MQWTAHKWFLFSPIQFLFFFIPVVFEVCYHQKFCVIFFSCLKLEHAWAVIINISGNNCDSLSINRPLIFFFITLHIFERKKSKNNNLYTADRKVCVKFRWLLAIAITIWVRSPLRECVQRAFFFFLAKPERSARRKVNTNQTILFSTFRHDCMALPCSQLSIESQTLHLGARLLYLKSTFPSIPIFIDRIRWCLGQQIMSPSSYSDWWLINFFAITLLFLLSPLPVSQWNFF